MEKSMERTNLEYLTNVIVSVWLSFINAPLVIKSCLFIGSFLLGLWVDLYVFIIGIIMLAGLDTHYAIKACIKNGGIYESHKVKKGLLVKFELYLTLSIMTITLDLIFHKIYNYEKYFITYLLFAFVALYECGSMVESLNVTHPNNKAVKKFSSFLNLSEKKLNNKLK